MRSLLPLILALSIVLVLPVALWLVQVSAGGLQRWQRRVLDRDFEDHFVFVAPRHFAVLAGLLAAVVGLALLWASRSPLLAALAAAASLALPAFGGRWWRNRRIAAVAAQLPDALELLATSLKSGLALQPALQTLAALQSSPLREELQLIVRKQRLGVALDEACAEFAARCGGGDLHLLAAALAMTRKTGGNLSEVLRRLAATLRSKEQLGRKLQALTAQGKLQGWVVGLLPLALLVVMQQLEPAAMRLLYTTHIGWLTLAVLLALELGGALMLRRLLRIEV